MELASLIRDVPDFPVEGILFKDITTLIRDADAFREVIDQMTEHYADIDVDLVVAIEARGYILGAPLAYALGAGFVPVRKPGKLPAGTISESYTLEYGTNTLEIHEDAIKPGQWVLVVDDLLATGGSARATVNLVERLGGKVAGVAFMIELDFLHGRDILEGYDILSLIHYD
jgi:adenine phosphoribosyltransferase